MPVSLARLVYEQLIAQLDQLEALQVLTELVGRLEGQSVDQDDGLHGHVRVFTQEYFVVGQNLLQVLDDVALCDFWVSLVVSEQPRDNLKLEHRISLRELCKQLECQGKLRRALKVLHQEVLNDLKGHVQALDLADVMVSLAIRHSILHLLLAHRSLFIR